MRKQSRNERISKLLNKVRIRLNMAYGGLNERSLSITEIRHKYPAYGRCLDRLSVLQDDNRLPDVFVEGTYDKARAKPTKVIRKGIELVPAKGGWMIRRKRLEY